MKYILLLAAGLALFACKSKETRLEDQQKEIETGSLDSTHSYTAAEIGWTMPLRKGWDVQTKENIRANTENGKKIMEETLDANIDVSGLKQLLNLHKGRFNSFLSTIQPYDTVERDHYSEKNQFVYSAIKDAYAGKNIPAEYSEGAATIDGLQFNVFRVTIYNKDKSEKILK